MKTITNYDMAEGSRSRWLVYETKGGYTAALMLGTEGVPVSHHEYPTLLQAIRKAGIKEWREGVDTYYGGKVDTRTG